MVNIRNGGVMRYLKTVILILLFFGMFFTTKANAQEDFKLYYKMKKLMHQRQYDSALQLFEQLKIKHPDSRYLDDAEFWSAYILERQDKSKEAFNAFKNFKKKYPVSPYVDDAVLQQIGIAERLARTGKRNYINFLVTNLKSTDKSIKYQASVSLGKLRDKRALPALKQMANNGDRDMSLMAKSLIKNIESKPVTKQPKIRVLPDTHKKIGRDKINGRSLKQPPIHTPDNRPGNIKQPQKTRNPSARIQRPVRQSSTRSRTPSTKTTSPTRRSQPQKSTLNKND